VDHLDSRGKLCGIDERKPLHRLGPQEVLHRHRLAGAQQRPIEHRVAANFRLRLEVGRQIEPPRLDAFLPLAEDEARVDDALCRARRDRFAGRDEITIVDQTVAWLRGERRVDAGRPCASVRPVKIWRKRQS
jgi:hypothetical protein